MFSLVCKFKKRGVQEKAIKINRIMNYLMLRHRTAAIIKSRHGSG